MKIIRTTDELKKSLLSYGQEKTIGFVPTMGYLHEGHLSLAKVARKENDLLVMSIFVNPLQFGPNEDFEQYPRDEQKDAALAKEVGVDILFIPTIEEMYPEPMSFHISVVKGADVLCGKNRPGHFDGVATVLTKLFNLIDPTRAYFGLKDAQQFAIVHALIKQFNFPIELIGLPTVRDADGLAKSSRNVYLSVEERKEAKSIHEALQVGKQAIELGNSNPEEIVNEMKMYLETHTNGEIDYVNVYSFPKLETVDTIGEQVILAIAVQYEKVRLIDNLIIRRDGSIIDSFR